MDEKILFSVMQQAFARKDTTGLARLMSEDVELRPPTYGGSWRGRALVKRLVSHAASVFSEFVYTDHVYADEVHIFRFECRVARSNYSGVDLVRIDEHDRIVLIEIFSRPPKIALEMLEGMTQRIRNDPETAAMMRNQ